MISDKNILKAYLVTDNKALGDRSYFEVVEESILGGVTLVQIREKDVTSRQYYEKAKKLKLLTSKYNIPLIINDRVDIALAVGADGVHVGQKDIPVKDIRKIVGEDFIVGATANSVELAIEAEAQGADYLGVGALFPTSTKDDTKPLTPQMLKKIVESVSIPVVAIGGISIDNIKLLKDTGIVGVAVSSGIMGNENPKKAAREIFEFYL